MQPARIDNVTYNDHPQLQNFLFIAGLHRSGTTLLERLMTANFDVSYLRANVPESEGQHMQTVYSPAYKFGGPGRFAFNPGMEQELLELDDYGTCRATLLSDWQPFVVGTAKTLLEKSPPNLTKIWWLRAVFPGCRFLIMTRDPRATTAATQKWTNTSLAELMMHWNAAYSKAMEDYRDSDCAIVRYEDLTNNANEELERIANFCNIRTCSKKPDQLEERHRTIHNSNGAYIAAHGGNNYGVGIWEQFGCKM
ncbi:MAG: sulfotransferase family protein [Hyphomicrobiaceae bacterium]